MRGGKVPQLNQLPIMSTPAGAIILTLETLGELVEQRQRQKVSMERRNRTFAERHLIQEESPTLEVDQSALQNFFQGSLWRRFAEHLLSPTDSICICHSKVGLGGESYWVDRNGNLHLVWGGSNYPIWDTRRGWNIVVSILGGTEKVLDKIRQEMQKLFDREHCKILP